MSDLKILCDDIDKRMENYIKNFARTLPLKLTTDEIRCSRLFKLICENYGFLKLKMLNLRGEPTKKSNFKKYTGTVELLLLLGFHDKMECGLEVAGNFWHAEIDLNSRELYEKIQKYIMSQITKEEAGTRTIEEVIYNHKSECLDLFELHHHLDNFGRSLHLISLQEIRLNNLYSDRILEDTYSEVNKFNDDLECLESFLIHNLKN